MIRKYVTHQVNFGLFGFEKKKSDIKDYDYSKHPTDKIYNRNIRNYFFKDLNKVKISPIQKSIIEYQYLASDLGHIMPDEISESLSQGRYTLQGAKKGAVLVGDTEFMKTLDLVDRTFKLVGLNKKILSVIDDSEWQDYIDHYEKLTSKWSAIDGGADKSYDKVINFIQKNEKEFKPLERIETQYNKDLSTYKMRY